MPTSDEDVAVAPPGARKAWISVLLLALFSPVVLAVGAAVMRPAWLLLRPAGLPVSVIWVFVSMIVFVVATWILAAQALASDKEGGQ